MKRVLTPEILHRLNGMPIRLSSPYADGQLLSVDEKGEISLESDGTEKYDQRWSIVPSSEGFQIVSSRYGFMICHHPFSGGIVSAVKKAFSSSDKGCTWQLNEKGEIYQSDPMTGGKKYLWLAGSHLYITRDGFLAERWAPFFPGEKLPSPVGPQYQWKLLLIGVVAILLLLIMRKR